MARRWLLGTFAGIGLTFGLASGASAQTLPGTPVEVDAEVASVTVAAEPDAGALVVEATTDVAAPAADTAVAPEVETSVTPAGPAVEVDGAVEVAGNELDLGPAAPADDLVASDDGDSPAPAPVVTSRAAAADGRIAPVAGPRPAAAPATDAGGTRAPAMSADRAAVRAGLASVPATVVADDVPAPLVAPEDELVPIVAAAAPDGPAVSDLALPVIDTTPTVPGILRLLAGLLVVGAAVTWRSVREELG